MVTKALGHNRLDIIFGHYGDIGTHQRVGDCRLQKNLADSYRKVGRPGKMSDVAWQASSHDLVETSDSQRNPVVFAVRMALRRDYPM